VRLITVHPTGAAATRPATDAVSGVTALYQASALALVRLAHIMIGDRGLAEDIVQEAFCGLHRRWAHLSDPDKALAYVRSSVLNACRSAQRGGQSRRRSELTGDVLAFRATRATTEASGEVAVLGEEERVVVMAALRRLPHRQRDVVVLRFYLDMSEAQIAAQMGIRPGTVRSTAHRALAALSTMLKERQ
jgi:RNA polymerase sigma-70 factor (sigma-E family)